MDWLPIENAPKTGRRMFVVKAVGVRPTVGAVSLYTTDPWCVWRDGDGSFARWPHPFPPTHWLELPDDPAPPSE